MIELMQKCIEDVGEKEFFTGMNEFIKLIEIEINGGDCND